MKTIAEHAEETFKKIKPLNKALATARGENKLAIQSQIDSHKREWFIVVAPQLAARHAQMQEAHRAAMASHNKDK